MSLDLGALRDGVGVAALTAVPFGIVARLVVTDDRPRGWVGLLGVLVLLGLLLGAGVAAWRQDRGTPLTHGIVTAVGVFLVVQVIGTLRRAVAGDPIHWARISSGLVLSLVTGVIGGFLGSFVQRSGVRSRL